MKGSGPGWYMALDQAGVMQGLNYSTSSYRMDKEGCFCRPSINQQILYIVNAKIDVRKG